MKKTFLYLTLLILAIGIGLLGCGGHGVDQIISSSSTSSSSVTGTSSTSTTTLVKHSISGTVKFASTSDPVKDGVYISVKNGTGTIIGSAITNNGTGAYSISGIPSGSYTIEATKESWSLSSEAVTVSNANLTADFALFPTQWDILNVGGGVTFNSITSYEGVIPFAQGKMFVACDNGAILQASAPFISWNSFPSPAFTSVVAINDLTPNISNETALICADRDSFFYVISSEVAGWFKHGPITSEAIKAFVFDTSFLTISDPSSRLIIAGSLDITPTNEAGLIFNNVASTVLNFSTLNVTMEVVGNNGKAFLSNLTSVLTPEWQGINLGTNDDLSACALPMRGVGPSIIGSVKGSIYMSSDLINWKTDLSGIPYAISGAYITMPGTVFVCGANGLIMRRK